MNDFDVHQAAKFFNEQYFLDTYPGVRTMMFNHPGWSAFDIFCISGHILNLKPNPYFSPDYYLKQRPDIANAVENGSFGITSAFHYYMLQGYKETTAPNILFNEQHFLDKNPDVKQAVANGFFGSGAEYFMRWGANEYGRFPCKIVLSYENEKFKVEDTSDFEAPQAVKEFLDTHLISSLEVIAQQRNLPNIKFLTAVDLGTSFIYKFSSVISSGGTLTEATVEGICDVLVTSMVATIGSAIVTGTLTAMPITVSNPVSLVAATVGGGALVAIANNIDFTKDKIEEAKSGLAKYILNNQESLKTWKQSSVVSTPEASFKHLDELQEKIDYYHKPVAEYMEKYYPDSMHNSNIVSVMNSINAGTMTKQMGMDQIIQTVGNNDAFNHMFPHCAHDYMPLYIENTDIIGACGHIDVQLIGQ